MPNFNPQVDKYISSAPDFAKPILKHLREVIHKTCPDVEEKIKWGNPHLDYKGTMVFMAAFKAHIAFGFWKWSLMKDPEGLFKKNKEAMGSLGRLTDLSQLPSDEVLVSYIKEAMQLNIDGKKVVVTKHAKPKLVIPGYFLKVLEKNKKAEENFENMSPSHKREYVEWIEGAKKEETRQRRIAQAVDQLKDGKSQNEKYE